MAYGSPPQKHRTDAKWLLKQMRHEKAIFGRVLARGDCIGALDTLFNVEALGSAAYRERYGHLLGTRLAQGKASLGRVPGGTARLRRQMRRRFLSKCRVSLKRSRR